MSKFDPFQAIVEAKKAEHQARHESMRLKRRELLHALAIEADLAMDGRKNRAQKALIKGSI